MFVYLQKNKFYYDFWTLLWLFGGRRFYNDFTFLFQLRAKAPFTIELESSWHQNRKSSKSYFKVQVHFTPRLKDQRTMEM
jgi:hypothetical protein